METERQAAKVGLAEFVEHTTNHKLDLWQRDLCARLETLAYTTGRRMLIHAPPQAGKSIIVSQRFPAWMLTRKPAHRIKLACYNVTHSTRFSKIVRDLMQEADFARLFPNPGLRLPTTVAADEWSTAARSASRDSQPSFKALGLATGFVGQGADCFPAETRIKTEIGDIDIRTLTLLKCKPQVFAYNHLTGEIVLRRIQAAREIQANELLEVVTKSGRRFRCTPDHRIFVKGKGYIPASKLASGDRLTVARSADLSEVWPVQERRQQGMPKMSPPGALGAGQPDLRLVQERLSAQTIRFEEMAKEQLQRHILLYRLCASASRHQKRWQVQSLWKTQAALILVLLRCLQSRIQAELEDSRTAAKALRILSSALQAGFVKNSILFREVRGRGTFDSDARQREFALQRWFELCQVVRGNAAIGDGAGQLAMRGLQYAGTGNAGCLEGTEDQSNQSARSSHQPRSTRQHARQSNYPLQEVPLQTPQIESDAVAMVRCIRSGQVSVYDIQVEGCHNFFAEGILAHNCLIIDDPYADPQDAYSTTINGKVRSFWTDTAKPRLNDFTNVVVMFHRYCEPDLAGFLMESEPDEWELVRYAALADGDYEHPVTKRLYPDPMQRPEGEKLSPRYSDAWYEKQKENTFVWLSQFQGRPTAKEGTFFKITQFIYENSQAIAAMVKMGASAGVVKTVRAWDLAASKNGDWTVGVKMALLPSGRLLVVDVVRGRWLPDERDAQMLAAARMDGKQTRIFIPQDPGQAGVDQSLRLGRMLHGFKVTTSPVSGDKITRAEGLASQINVGNVTIAQDADWKYQFVEEFRQFPLGGHDDQVDAAVDAYRELLGTPTATSGRVVGLG